MNMKLRIVDAQEGIEKRRVPRIRLGHEQFRLQDNGKIFSVSDLSLDGIALRVLLPEDFALLTVGRMVSGHLKVDDRKVQVHFSVRHVGQDFVGGEFTSLDPVSRAALEDAMSPESVGKGLRLLPPSGGVDTWMQGPGGADFLMWRTPDGSPNHWVFAGLGVLVEWTPDDGVRTGRLTRDGARGPASADENRSGLLEQEPVLVLLDPTPDGSRKTLALTALLNSSLAPDIKSFCETTLK